MTYKNKMAVITGYVSFFAGWILTIINFFYPPIGFIADGTLWVLGQGLLYTGAVIGITQYTKGQIKKIRHSVGLPPEEEEDEED